MKKRFITILFITFISLYTLIGCSPSNVKVDIDEDNKINIVTSFYPMYILTSNIAKGIDNVEVVNLTKPHTGCLHDYSLSTNEMKILEDCDIFVTNGAGMEAFMDKIVKEMPELNIIESSEGIELLENSCNEDHTEHEEHAEHEEHEEHAEHEEHVEHDHEVNPHIWLSISKAIEQVNNIGNMLGEYDPTNKEKYDKNMEEYVSKLEELKIEMHQELDGIKGSNIVTFHEAFPYFAEEFDLNIVGVIEREPGSQPSAKDIQESIELIKSLDVKAIFTEPQYPAKTAETISKETGVKVYTLDPIVTGELELDSYINIMKKNMKTLKESLNDGE